MDRVFELLEEAAMIIFKVVVKALAKKLINRHCKKKTAPTADRDGSGNK